jgi:hypothetical protein
MSKRYIPQTPSNDFVYPNNDKVEYDQEIVHEINDNVVYGTVSGLTVAESSGNLLLNYTFTWDRNGAQVFLRDSGSLGLLSVHVLAPGQDYMSAWRMIDSVSNSDPDLLTYTAPISRTIAPSSFELTSWPTGEYQFEFRFIGLKQNYVVCTTATLEEPVTPTPTPTGTGPTPTPTPSETPEVTFTPTPTATPTATPSCTYWSLRAPTMSGELLVVDYNDCDGNPQTITMGWNGATQFICAETGSVVIVELGMGASATDTGTPCT